MFRIGDAAKKYAFQCWRRMGRLTQALQRLVGEAQRIGGVVRRLRDERQVFQALRRLTGSGLRVCDHGTQCELRCQPLSKRSQGAGVIAGDLAPQVAVRGGPHGL